MNILCSKLEFYHITLKKHCSDKKIIFELFPQFDLIGGSKTTQSGQFCAFSKNKISLFLKCKKQ